MLNQQDCTRLLQQARHFESNWTSPLEPARLWPVCLARDVIHRRLLGIQEHFLPSDQAGVLNIADCLLAGDWQELPPEWDAPDWFKVQRYFGRKACLVWDFQLQPGPDQLTRIQLQLHFVVPVTLMASLQTYFKRFSQALGQAFQQMEQAAPAWMHSADLPAAWLNLPVSPLRSAAEMQLGLAGWIDPILLARQTGLRPSQAIEFVWQLQLQHVLEPRWYGLEPDEGPPLADWASPWPSQRWPQESVEPQQRQNPWPQSVRTSEPRPPMPIVSRPEQTGLRFVLADRPATAGTLSERGLVALAADQGRCLLWPGQTRNWPVNAPLNWQLLNPQHQPLKQGKIRIRTKGAQQQELDLAKPQAAVLDLTSGGELLLKHTGRQLQGLCLTRPEQTSGTLRDLLSYQLALPWLLPAWPADFYLDLKACFLRLNQALPPPVLEWLQAHLRDHGGAMLAKQSLLLLFDKVETALACAEQLLQTLRQFQALGLAECRPGMALVRGRGTLGLRTEPLATPPLPELSLSGSLAERLDQLLAQSQGLDLILPATLLQDPSLQAPLKQAQWQLTEFTAGDEIRFQLRPPD